MYSDVQSTTPPPFIPSQWKPMLYDRNRPIFPGIPPKAPPPGKVHVPADRNAPRAVKAPPASEAANRKSYEQEIAYRKSYELSGFAAGRQDEDAPAPKKKKYAAPKRPPPAADWDDGDWSGVRSAVAANPKLKGPKSDPAPGRSKSDPDPGQTDGVSFQHSIRSRNELVSTADRTWEGLRHQHARRWMERNRGKRKRTELVRRAVPGGGPITGSDSSEKNRVPKGRARKRRDPR